MAGAAGDLQEAVFERLVPAFTTTQQIAFLSTKQIATLAGQQVRVFDDVPQGTAAPYVTIGEDTATNADTDSDAGEEITITVHTWSRYRGRLQTKAMERLVKKALHDRPLTVRDQNIVFVYFDYSDSMMDDDGVLRHGVVRFRVLAFEQTQSED